MTKIILDQLDQFMRLSLCIATYNEEQNIHYPLDSAYSLVDEVVLVDGGSTDKTVKKAKSYGKKVRVFSEDNPSMFHINKQKAIERARGEWILQLDADEELSPELKQEIRLMLEVGSRNLDNEVRSEKKNHISHIKNQSSNLQPQTSNCVAFWIPRKNFFLTRFLIKGGQYPDYTIRLYRNGYARFPCKNVHENVEILSQKSKVKSQKFNSKFKSDENVILGRREATTPESLLDSGPHYVEAPRGKQAFRLNVSQAEARMTNYQIGYLQNPILHYADPDFSRYLN